MFPAFFSDDLADMTSGDAERFAEDVVGHSADRREKPDRADLIGCQPRPCRALSSGAASLLGHVFRVVSAGAKEQVVRPDARRVIAPVENAKTFRDVSVGELPRHSMSTNDAASLTPATKAPVSFTGFAPGPKPAAVSFVDVLPEPFRRGSFSSFCLAGHTAATCVASADEGGRHEELGAAVFADALDRTRAFGDNICLHWKLLSDAVGQAVFHHGAALLHSSSSD